MLQWMAFHSSKGFLSKMGPLGKSARPCAIFLHDPKFHLLSSGSKDWDGHAPKAKDPSIKIFYQDADTATLRQLCISNIRPHLEYACQVWLSKKGCKYTRISSEVYLVSFLKTVGCFHLEVFKFGCNSAWYWWYNACVLFRVIFQVIVMYLHLFETPSVYIRNRKCWMCQSLAGIHFAGFVLPAPVEAEIATDTLHIYKLHFKN